MPCAARRRVAREGPRDPGDNPKRLAGGEGHGRRTQGGDGHGGALGEPFHALYPAAVIALISALLTLIVVHGREILKGWAGKGPQRRRAWITKQSVLWPVDVEEDLTGQSLPILVVGQVCGSRR